MTRFAARCPNCGAPVELLWAGAVQTTCAYCRAVLVRHDLELEKVGQVSARMPAVSPIRIGTHGSHGGRRFTVVGRIAYEYERGGWSEWHLVFGDGSSGWLSDAQAEYAVSFLAAPSAPLPEVGSVGVGERFVWKGTKFEVTSITRARYLGVEGELPFEYWDKDEVPFVDLRSEQRGFATLDYSEPEPLLFLGEFVGFEELRLSELREPAPAAAAEVAAVRCPNCGGGVTIRAAGVTVNVVCGSCGSILDARDPGVRVLQRVQATQRVEPLIPLGARGTWHGAEYQVIGFQVRGIHVEGLAYRWREYLLYNRERGFRYLTEYDGHWNDVVPLHSVPHVRAKRGRPTARVLGETFRHFQTAEARTEYVLGEFPWEVRAGDRARLRDYVAPPRILSAEEAGEETTWSIGEYTAGERIWAAFGLPGSPPRPRGVYANQPSPYRPVARQAWRTFGALLLLFLALLVLRMSAPHSREVFPEQCRTASGSPAEDVTTLGPFELRGRTANLQVAVSSDVQNGWAYFNFALVDQETGRATEFGREISYYQGYEDGERWSEGSPRDRVRIPSVPPGRYVLRVAPEAAAGDPLAYCVRLHRDVPGLAFWAIAFLLLLAPPLLFTFRGAGFESARWAESDHAPE